MKGNGHPILNWESLDTTGMMTLPFKIPQWLDTIIIIWEYDSWCRLGHGKHHHRLLICYCWWKKSCTTGDVKNCTANNGMNCLSSWWFQLQPIWNILVKMGSSSPIFGVNIKNIWVATSQLPIGCCKIVRVSSTSWKVKIVLHGGIFWTFRPFCQFGAVPQAKDIRGCTNIALHEGYV